MRKRLGVLWVACALCVVGAPGLVADVTDLTVTKSGNDVVLSWTTGTAPFSVSLSNTSPTFAQVQMLSSGLSSTAYTYTGGVTNGKVLQFFQVCDSVENCVAFTYTGGAAPPPVPQVGSVSPTGGLKVGDILTINGSGFSTMPTQNLVLFPQGITVTSNSSPAPTATSFQITIPRGAVSGTFRVQVGYQLSDPFSLTVYAQTGFAHVYGMSFQPTTTDIWLTDGGTGTNYSKCYSMTYNAGTGVWDKTARESAINSTPKYLGGQGFDSGGYYYYGLNNASTNGGVRRAQSNPPGSGGSFTQVSPSSGDSIQVAALATSPAFTNQVFVAYNDVTLGKKGVKLLGSSGPVIQDYGSFGSPGPNLAPIAGLALDSAGNLYLSATTQIIKITSSTSSTVVCGGFVRAEGISLYQSGAADAGTLLVVDNSTNTLYSVNLNDSSPTPQPVLTGLTIPRTASFALTPLASSTCSSSFESTPRSSALVNTLLAFALAGEDTQPRQIASAPISLDPVDPTCLWITKQSNNDQYPVPSIQSGDHQVVVTATVAPVPTSQKTVYFRVSDPPDSAPYGDGIHTGFWCDNKDQSTTNNHARLWDPGSSSWKDVVGVDASLTTGKASVTLNTSDRYAGDNYNVQASFDNWGGGATTPAMAETGVITNWKRIYIEKDKMFRRGNLFDADVVSPPAGQLYLARWDGTTPASDLSYVQGGDQIVIFDKDCPYPSGGYETATILNSPVPAFYDADLPGGGTKSVLRVYLDHSLSNTYTPSPYPSFADSGHNATGASAAVGVVSAGFYEADMSSLLTAFADAYVTFSTPPDGAGAVPFLPSSFFSGSYGAPISCFSQIWFHNWRDGGAPPPDHSTYPHLALPRNYFHLVGAGRAPGFDGASMSLFDWTFVMVQNIEDYGQGQPATARMIQETTVHEIGHQFDVNACTLDHHDNRDAWCVPENNCGLGGSTSEFCVMNSVVLPNPDAMDGVDRFCVEDLINGDPNCSDPTPPNPRPGAIRTDTDPY